jgi:2-polyprenyl-3-methyl-5-hydroxy-6-metoxy-1,4-benzoquinol methylase
MMQTTTRTTAPLSAMAVPDNACPVCHFATARWRRKHTPVGDFFIDRCTECDFAFVNPRPTAQFLQEFYSLSGHSRDGTDSGQTLDTVLAQEQASPNSTVDAARMIGTTARLLDSRLRNGAKLLDVGCGYGFYSREAIAQGFVVTAIELAATERSISKRLAGIEPLNTTFEDFDVPAGTFSAVIMSQILEHALDINAWLTKVRTLLHEGGVVAIALPNFGSLFRRIMQENEPFITPPAHLNFFTSGNLVQLLSRHGFVVRHVEWKSRISHASLQRRIPVVGRYLGGIANLALSGIDRMQLGMMLNVYATKAGPNKAGLLR